MSNATMLIRTFGIGFLAALALACAGQPTSAKVCLRGLNISGAEYGDVNGVHGTNYTYPSVSTVRYFADKGMNVVRLPFLWDRLQPALGGNLDQRELTRLNDAVSMIRNHGMAIVLDPHNFGYYGSKRLMTSDLTAGHFADFWIRVALEFADQNDVIFGLMNEPYDIPAEDWLLAANQAVAGIRAVGADNLILVPGSYWSGASSWENPAEGGANGIIMAGLVDPADNFAYEVHQYLDEDFSGTHDTCPQADRAVDALKSFTQWLERNDARGFLGEFGGSADPACLDGLEQMIETMDQFSERWVGWTYWAAGDWWPASEANNIQPSGPEDRPQLTAVMRAGSASAPAQCATQN
ncbi:glycoside hydrolase family 5 protein [Roseibium sp.]|uniref:glycoside hydrolase family 5 protein n=1 Tax=Roseibium sp. TaxID=1936156 RepID=UPI003A987E17